MGNVSGLWYCSPIFFNYLTFYPNELGSRDLCDYKTCKAYSYFKSGWLQELEYHSVSMDGEYCFIRGECRKSQSIGVEQMAVFLFFQFIRAVFTRDDCTVSISHNYIFR